MSEIPPPLTYMGPDPNAMPLRKKAARQCFGNGIGCILLGTCVGAAGIATVVGAAPRTAAKAPEIFALLGLIIAGYSLVFLASGIIHLIASFKIKRPDPTWERIVYITAGIHIGCVVIWIGILVWSMGRSGQMNIIPFIISLAIALSLAQGIQKVQKAER